MSKRKLLFINLGILFVFSLIYSLPLLIRSNVIHYEPHDTIFHLSRSLGLSNVWTSPVNFNNFHHHGTMMNIFYPWLTLYPMYIFYSLSGSLVFAYQAYFTLLTLVTMLSAYYSMHKIKNNHNVALLFALLYSFSTYRTTNIFARSAFGESIAQAFLPLILLGCYEIFLRNYKKWYVLSIGMTLVLYSHLLSVAMIAVVMALVILGTFYFWDHKKQRILSLIYATILTVALSIGFLLPFLQQSRAQELKVSSGSNVKGTNLFRMIEGILKNDLQKFTIGIFVFVILFVIALNFKKLLTIDKFIALLGFSVFFISTSLFPWFFLNGTPIDSIQFVWRLNAFSTLFLIYAFSSLISTFTSTTPLKKQYKYLLPLSVLITILHMSSIINQYHNYEGDRVVFTDDNIVERAADYNHTDYANKESLDHSDVIGQNQFFLDDNQITPTYSYIDSTYTIEIDNTESASTLITPTYRYLGQRTVVNGQPVESSLSKYGTTEIPVSSGINNIEISYSYTLLTRLSQIFSIIVLIIFCIWIFKRKKQNDL